MANDRYPYRHHGPAVHGDKLTDYLISEASLREDHPELFDKECIRCGSVGGFGCYECIPRDTKEQG